MQPAYIPGKCNIGKRGRAMRLATGLGIIVLSLILRFTLLNPLNMLFSLTLVVPLYIGFLAMLEGTMSFCVLHASKGTYDLNEPRGMPTGESPSRKIVESEEWKKLDRRKARIMHLEAQSGAVVLTLVLVLA
jgi:hypothetical protein